MGLLSGLTRNPFLLTGLSSWLIAQVLKVLLHAALTGQLRWERLFGDGGMPSGHAATVTALAVLAGLVYGTDSFAFAVCGILAVIVCHDAMGVRLETGRQAAVINRLLRESREPSREVLKEFVGHTPAQVAVGALIGGVNAFLMHRLLFL